MFDTICTSLLLATVQSDKNDTDALVVIVTACYTENVIHIHCMDVPHVCIKKSNRHHNSNIVMKFYFVRLEAMSACDRPSVS